jgi:Flp pilus assembly protein TadG
MRPACNDRGQVLIITAFAMIVLIAIAAIVVDLGFSWMLHRKEQNAADPAALAAAKYVPALDKAKMEAEACFYAQENGFFPGDSNCSAALASRDLDVNSPPATTLAGKWQGTFGYVEVIITSTHPSFFGQFFGQPVASVTTAAVAALTNGNANTGSLVALGRDCGGADAGDSKVTGGGTITVHPASGVTQPGGYINVNAPCGGIGNSHYCDGNGSSALAINGGGTLSAPHAFVVGGCSTNGGGSYGCVGGPPPCLDEQAIPLGDPLAGLPEPWPTLTFPVPTCPKLSEINGPGDPNPCNLTQQNCPAVSGINTCTMSPGVYYAGWDIGNHVKVVLKPGMYVLAGFGIRMNAGASMESVGGLDVNGNTIDPRVTMFSTDYTAGCQAGQNNFCVGPIDLKSSGRLVLKATDANTCKQVVPTICAWRNILFWQDGTVVGTPGYITVNGQADLWLTGTIYAPESSVTISGGSGTTGCNPGKLFCLAIQIIAQQWWIEGGAIVDMPYDPSLLYPLMQRGLVH